MDEFSIGSFLGAFFGALLATPIWIRQMRVQIDKLKACAHCHKGECPTLQPVVMDRPANN